MSSDQPTLPRRQFLGQLATLSGGLALTACGGSNTPAAAVPAASLSTTTNSTTGNTHAPANGRLSESQRQSLPRPPLPAPADSGIDHVVLVTMENRSFDHYMSWVPGAEGMVVGKPYPDAFGRQYTNFHLADMPAAMAYQGCSFSDPDHSYSGGRTHVNHGGMDGFLLSPNTNQTPGDLFPIGYYRGEDLAFYSQAAKHYTVCDYYRSGILSMTYPNRIYLHTGATDRLDNAMTPSALPAIWDRLKDKGVSASYYFNDIPFTALFGQRFVNISKPFAQFALDVASGQLPAFSMIDPRFGGEGQGLSNDDHPQADIRAGQLFLSQVYNTLASNPAVFARTLIVIVYDEWGGFFDHVLPIKRPISEAEAALPSDGLLGLRVPCVLMGPRVRASHVCQYPLDPSSIHQFLAWRFGLDPLGVRGSDPDTINLAYALDFSQPARTDVPAMPVANAIYGSACPTGNGSLDGLIGAVAPGLQTTVNGVLAYVPTPNTLSDHVQEVNALIALGRQLGFPVP